MKWFRLLPLLALLCLPQALLAQPFIISDIRVEGLQRISAGSVFAAMPIAVGDLVDEYALRATARSLFATGNFDDIKLAREGNVLVIVVAERPSISEINITGNKAIKTEDLLEGLKGAGLSVGQVFKRATLEGMQMELQRQYVQQGRYDAGIETEVLPEPRNRVSINVEVDEGTVAKIKHINIIGNTVFDDDELGDILTLKTTNWLSWFRNDDKYSREKFSADIEKLASYYLDRGYLQFRVDSTQVAVGPERESVYISVNIDEGEKFTIGSVDLSGDLVVPEEDLRRFLLVQEGQTYSQQLVTSSEEFMTNRLGNEGYNFAKVTGIPEIDEETGNVNMRFFVDPGKRTYVRRITFAGNTRTTDEVLRREMRQMEGAPASQQSIELSRIRLERLGFFREAKVDTTEVSGHDDLIDVEFEVEEQSSGSIGASFGYAQQAGLIVGLNLQQNNFFGSGKAVGVGVNTSRFQDSINFSYTNPYYTVDGVSRGFNVFYRETNLDAVNVASFTTNTIGGNIQYGYPIKETQRLGFSVGVSHTDITTGRFAVQEIRSSPRLDPGIESFFISQRRPDGTLAAPEEVLPLTDLPPSFLPPPGEPGFLDENGTTFLNWTMVGSWRQSTLNRGIFATRGMSNDFSLEFSVPGVSDLEFYKLRYNFDYYYPLTNSLTLRLRAALGYGDGYGNTSELPFYEHFFAGGFGSVRGFRINSLGSLATQPQVFRVEQPVTAIDDNGNPTQIGGPDGRQFGYVASDGSLIIDAVPEFRRPQPFGGNTLVEGSAEIIFPLPFVKDQYSFRPTLFFDWGNVFDTRCSSQTRNCFDVDPAEIRYSVGVGLTWLSGFGPISVAIAKPMNAGPFDRKEVFQFSLGRGL